MNVSPEAAPSAPPPSSADGFATAAYRRFVLVLLLLVFCFEVMDRILFGIVQEALKSDLSLSDFELGLLGGPAFVLLHSVAALPIAYFADRYSRVAIVSMSIGLWSFATALCGVASNFLQLVGLRMLVGVGGAGCLPPSHALIADYFPLRQRASALSIFGLAIPIGSLVAAVLGGWIAQNYGWRSAFLCFGIPGVAMGLIVRWAVREPPRTAPAPAGHPLEAFRELLRKPAFVHITAGSALISVYSYASNQFLISFLVRNYGLALDQAALYFGVAIMGATAAGIFSGGFLADRLKARDSRALVLVPIGGIACSIPFYGLGLMQTEHVPMITLYAAGSLLFFLYLSPTFAALQGIAGPQRRASVTALYLMVSTLIGFGLGPPLVGWAADRGKEMRLEAAGLMADSCDRVSTLADCVGAGGEGLRIALLCALVCLVLGLIHFGLAARHIRNDLVD